MRESEYSMKRQKVQSILLIFMIILLLSPMVAAFYRPPIDPPGGGEETYNMYGYVKVAGSGAAIYNARVSLYSDIGTYLGYDYTDASGYFQKSVTCGYCDFFQAVVTKSGYETESKYGSPLGTNVNFGNIYMDPAGPPPATPPTIGTPSAVRDTPYQATISVSVTWHYNPYISRTVWIEWGGAGGQFLTMQPVGGMYTKTITGLDPSASYDYRIKATEVFYDAGMDQNREGTSYSSTYNIASWPTPNLAGMDYMQWHTIHGSPGAGTNYQVRVTVHYDTGFEGGEHVYTDGKCDTNFNNIRFTTGDGKVELPHWREYCYPGDYAVFWVRMYDNLDNDATFRMYYGDNGVASASNGDMTFIFFEDGENGNLDRWDTTASAWSSQTNQVKNGQRSMYYNGASSDRQIAKNLDISGSFMIHTWHRATNALRGTYLTAYWAGTSHYTYYARQFGHDWAYYHGSVYLDWTGDSRDDAPSGTWIEMEVGFDTENTRKKLWNDGTDCGWLDHRDSSGNIVGTYDPLNVLYFTGQSGYTTWFDDLYIRKWIPDEPTHGDWVGAVLIEDFSGTSGWTRYTSYNSWKYPFEDPAYGVLNIGNPTGEPFFYCDSVPSPTQEVHEGPVFVKNVDDFRLSSLESFEVDLRRPTVNQAEKGSFYIALYDDHTLDQGGSKPILYIKLEDTSIATSRLKLVVGYFDEAMNEYVDLIESYYSSPWADTLQIWFDHDTGLWIDHDLGGPIQHLDWTGLNPSRVVSYVAMQWAKYYLEPMPDLRVYGISIHSYEGADNVDYNKAIGLRSGLKGVDIQRPGPYNEIQFFPQDGDGKIKFWFIGDLYDQHSGTLTLDIRRIRLYDPTSVPEIRVWWNGVQLTAHDLLEDPFQSTNTVNYLHQWDLVVQPVYNEVEIDVRGGDWHPMDVVALRGIWLTYSGLCNTPHQIFPDSGELVYFVPIGPDSRLDLDWWGSSPVEVWIDGQHKVTQSTPANDISLGDYARNSLHEVRIVYQGSTPSEASLCLMHIHHLWMNIEVDWIEGNDPRGIFGVNFDGFETWWRTYTHGRIDIEVSDVGLPASNYNTSTLQSDYYLEEVIEIGYLYFDNLGKRNWFWTLYVPNAGYHYPTYDTIVGGYQWWVDSNNGWKRWLLTTVGLYDAGIPNPTCFVESIMQHEWGHAAHVHEGYSDPYWAHYGEPCTAINCVYNGLHLGIGIAICEFHWRQTWQSIPAHPRNPYHWAYDWFLL